ncbi:MAG TPA: hypothetical protein DCZ94_05100 [Lentisphaeria bacterium]|nr:MAG: hypothetical protein A2X48_07710 [Lentisphaerae bacterium GWF2_49_21]HBC86315.1 hypothetical protein [Lentisphaeria bacterium]
MNVNRLVVIIVCIVSFCLPAFSNSTDEIQIPKCHMQESLLYLAKHLGMNIINTNVDLMSKSFSSNATDTKEIIEQFKKENKDTIDIWYDHEHKTLICSDKRLSNRFQQFLESKILLDKKDDNLYVLLGQKKKKLEINGISFRPLQGVEAQAGVIFVDTDKIFSRDITVKQFIFGLNAGKNNLRACKVPFIIGMTESQKADERRIAGELKQRIEAIEGGADKADAEELNNLKSTLANSLADIKDFPEREPESYNIYVSCQKPDDWKAPTYEQIAQLLNAPGKTPGGHPFEHVEFFYHKAIEYDTDNFISALFKYKVFDNDPVCGCLSSGVIFLMSGEIPDLIAESNNYDNIQYLLKNIGKMKSRKFQEHIISVFRDIDKDRLDKESLDIFLSLAKEFKIESIYVDTSKWIGDELPGDYDRWKNFNVPETKLVLEEDKPIGKSKYHLKFFKYISPVKIGGIPLKTFEQADFSTPERAFFSATSARNYEWEKASHYGEFRKEYYSPLRNWKPWHSGLDHFTEILYKVEVEDGRAKAVGLPHLFLVLKLLDDNNKIVASPMTLDKTNWKFILSRTVHMDILSDFIEEKICGLKN